MIFRQKTSYYTLYISMRARARKPSSHCSWHNPWGWEKKSGFLRSALQPSPQCSATRPAVHCIRRAYLVQFQTHVLATAPARTCVRHGKYMRPPGITFATAKYNVCNRGCKRYKPLLQTFAGKPLWRDADEYAACTFLRHIGELATVSYAHTCMTD